MCDICCENMNKGTHREVSCPYCEFTSCLICFRRYLMESTNPFPDCMSCHHEFTLDFVAKSTPKTFHDQEYRKKRVEDLFSQERSLLPDTQHLVEQRMIRLKRKEEIAELIDEEKYLKFRMKEIRQRIRDLRSSDDAHAGEEKKERKKFIMGCPNGECRGFLSQAWKCGTCGIYACNKCRAVKNGHDDDEHECDKDTVLTYEMLKAETKPCPKCAIPIYKISGCDQMWCVECHTPFSWKTGEVVTGVIHNPHFYQHQREQNNGVAPRVTGDIPGGGCGELPWAETLEHVIEHRKHKFDNWRYCHRLVGHIRDVVIPRYPATIGIRDNTDLRVKFLTNEIGEKKWRYILKMRQKKHEKDRAINQVLEMFVIVLTDLFNTYVSGDTSNLAEDAETLRSYVNRELLKIGRQYNNKTPFISKQWEER